MKKDLPEEYDSSNTVKDENILPAEETRKKSNKKKVIRKIFGVFMGTLTAVVAFFGILFGANWLMQNVAGYEIIVPISGSMEPTINVGDAAYTENIEPEDIQVGDIIVVENPQVETRVTHRVIEVLEQDEVDVEELRLGTSNVEVNDDSVLFRMQGDANNTPDPRDYVINSSDEVSRVIDYPVLLDGPFVIPNGGHIVQFQNTPQFYYAFAVLIAAIFVWGFWPQSNNTNQARKQKTKPKDCNCECHNE